MELYDCYFHDMSGFSPDTWRCPLQRKHRPNSAQKTVSLMLLQLFVDLHLREHSILTLMASLACTGKFGL